MNQTSLYKSCCRHCRHYQIEGRRGGHCHKLGVPVQGVWEACSLAALPFAPSWEQPSEMGRGVSLQPSQQRSLVTAMPPPY